MSNYIKKIDWKDLLERAVWTFVEGFLVALPVTLTMDISGAAWKTILFSAALSGVSAVKTLILDIARQHNEQYKAKEIEPDEYGDIEEYFEREDDKEEDKK